VADEAEGEAWNGAGAEALPVDFSPEAVPDGACRRVLTPLPLDPSRLGW